MNPAIRAILMTNPKAGESWLLLAGTRDLRIIPTGIITAIGPFIEVSSGMRDLASAPAFEPPIMSRMKRDLEDSHSESAPYVFHRDVFHREVERCGKEQEAADDRAGEHADAVSRNPMHRGVVCCH